MAVKKQHFVISHGTYPFDVLVCIGYTHEEMLRALKKKGCTLDKDENDPLRLTGAGRTTLLKGGQTVLQIALPATRIDFHAHLAHEIFHAVEFLFDRIGITHGVETTSEAYAYQIGRLTASLLHRLK